MARPQNLAAREGILTAATKLLHAGGYRGVSMDDVARKAGLQKSNLFHYYPTKEELVLAVIERAARERRDLIARKLAASGDPIRLLERDFSELADAMEKEGCCKGCLIGNMAEEMSDEREKIRRAIADHLAFWIGALSDFLKKHKAAGYFRKDFDPSDAASAIVALIEGSMLVAKASRKAEPIRQAGAMAAAYLKAGRA